MLKWFVKSEVNTLYASSATFFIFGWGAPVTPSALKAKKCSHSSKFAVIIISVLRSVGNTPLACCGVSPLSRSIK